MTCANKGKIFGISGALPLHPWRGDRGGEASEGRNAPRAQRLGGRAPYEISQYPPTRIAAAEKEARSAW